MNAKNPPFPTWELNLQSILQLICKRGPVDYFVSLLFEYWIFLTRESNLILSYYQLNPWCLSLTKIRNFVQIRLVLLS